MSAPRILVIDDDPSVHEAVGVYLRLSGFEVSSASDGQAGLAAAEAQVPDLILLDAQMPVMDGFRTLTLLRARPAFATTPILMLTSLAQTNLKVRGLELGADDYIVKPFEKAELVARVKRALRRVQALPAAGERLEGNLENLALGELLQALELGGKTGTVQLPDMGAEIRLRKGGLAGASWRGFSGREALLRILLAGRGRFRVEFQEPGESTAPSEPLQGALLESLTLVDEIVDILGRAVPTGSWVRPASEEEGDAAFAGAPAFPVATLDLVAALSGDIKDTARRVGRAVAKGVLIPFHPV